MMIPTWLENDQVPSSSVFFFLGSSLHQDPFFGSSDALGFREILDFGEWIEISIENRFQIQMSLDWFKGKFTGNHGFYH